VGEVKLPHRKKEIHMKLTIQKLLLVVFVLAAVIIPAILFAAGEAPYVTLRNKKIADGVYACDATTSTLTAMKVVLFQATSVAGVASVTFGTGFFRSKSTYYVIVTEQNGNTITPNAATVTNNTGNSCTVYTNGITAVVNGIAVGL
jgi:hypothetical protein